jgi:hypothetical protein
MRARFRCRLRAALLVGLLARAYTVVVSAAGDAVGTALFEL